MLDIIKRISRWTGKQRKKLIRGYVYTFLQSIFIALPVVGATYGLNAVLNDYRGIESLSPNILYFEVVALTLCVLGRGYFAYRTSVLQESIGFEKGAQERIEVGEVLKRVSLGFFDRTSTGRVSNIVTSELNMLENYSMKMINVVVNGYITAFTMILFMAVFSFPLAVISVGGVMLSAMVLNVLGTKSGTNAVKRQHSQDVMVGATLEYIRGLSIVKAFSGEGLANQSLKKAYGTSKDINVKIERTYTPLNCLHLLVLKITSVLIVFAAALMTLDGQMGLMEFLMMTIFSFIIFEQVESMNAAVHILKNIDKTLDQLRSLKEGQIIDEEGKNIELDAFDIEFNNVSFAYDEKPILKGMSFYIPQNRTTAIVGPSGSGKTTICHLISRFYDVQKGQILIGSRDVKTFTCESLLNNISMVFQNVYLFNDTVMNNIRFGMPGASDEAVIEAARKARCHEFIMKLKDGYNTVVGEGGSSLSGGEKQRVSIARAILKNSPIIILDEATASIDPENEHYIQEAIGELTKGKTIIVIAHRIATIENADQIIVVNEGRVEAAGSHEDLVKRGGTYKNFIDIRKQTEEWKIKTPA